MPVLVGVAQLAVELRVRPLRAQLVVQGALALDAAEALAVVHARLGRHLLGLEHLRRYIHDICECPTRATPTATPLVVIINDGVEIWLL